MGKYIFLQLSEIASTFVNLFLTSYFVVSNGDLYQNRTNLIFFPLVNFCIQQLNSRDEFVTFNFSLLYTRVTYHIT